MVVTLPNSFLESLLDSTEDIIFYKDYVRGPFTVTQVPYRKFSTIGPDGTELYIPGDVMYRVSQLIEEMYLAGKKEVKYH